MRIWGSPMTEFWSKLSVHNPYTTCTQPVHTVVLALGLMSGSAHAGAWEEFERRCLAPMENVQPLSLDGLDEIPNGALGRATRAFGEDQDTWGRVILTDDSKEPIACMFIPGRAANRDFEKAWTKWRDTALSSGQYLLIETDDFLFPEALESTYREPRLHVKANLVGPDAGPSIYTTILVEETDLES